MPCSKSTFDSLKCTFDFDNDVVYWQSGQYSTFLVLLLNLCNSKTNGAKWVNK